MRKKFRLVVFCMLMILSACGQNAQVETATPTETPEPLIRFVTPLDGATISYDDLRFQVNPVDGAEGYAWIFIQNGNVIWDTLKDEQRLADTEYSIPDTGILNDKFSPGELQVQVKTRIKGVWAEPAMIKVYLPVRAIVNIPANTQTPIPVTRTVQPTKMIPSKIGTPTSQPGWRTYVNNYLGYQFDYPSSMTVHTEDDLSLFNDETIPADFTFDEYFSYLENILPNNLCVLIESDSGMIAIAPPGNSIGRFVSPCPGMGIGSGYRSDDSSQTFLVNGRQYLVNGRKLYLESTGELDSEFYMFNLKNGFRITWISGPPKGMAMDAYSEQLDVLKKVLSTLTWTRIPDLTIPGTTCAGNYPRLLPGVWAQVAPGDPNRVRSEPSKTAEIIGQLYPGTTAFVIEGPVCADGLVYWKVEHSTITGGAGWTAEGDGKEYWLEPMK